METQPVKRLQERQRPAGMPGGNLEEITVADIPAAYTQGSFCDWGLSLSSRDCQQENYITHGTPRKLLQDRLQNQSQIKSHFNWLKIH